MLKEKLTSELFEEFTQSVLSEHKHNKKLHDECIDIYSKTQFFNFSNIELKEDIDNINCNSTFNLADGTECQFISNVITNLPFENIFIKNKFSSIFIREFNQNTITGCYIRNIKEGYIYKQPFTITYLFDEMFVRFDVNNLISSLKHICNDVEIQNICKYFIRLMSNDIISISIIFEKLNKRIILIDEPITNKAKYYRYKDKSKGSLKVNSRPIYIVLDEEKRVKKYNYDKICRQGNLRRDFSFPVIGHWRKLNNNNHLGKDRQGNYNVKGYTWVKSFIKGDKNSKLTQKERIIFNQ